MNYQSRTIVSIFFFLFIWTGLVVAHDLDSAIKQGDLDAVKALLGQHPELLNLKDGHNMTPVNLASFEGQKEIVAFLINKGADLSLGDNENSKPLHNAAAGGHRAVAQLILKSGADINEQDDNGMTPLAFAASWGHQDVFEFLIKKGADSSLQDTNGRIALHHAATGGKNDIVKVLLDKGSAVNVQDKQGQTALHYAARAGHGPTIELLLSKGADINAVDEHDQNALDKVIFSPRNVEVAKLLLHKGIMVKPSDNSGDSLLLRTIRYGKKDIATVFLEHGIQADTPSEISGKTALHIAALKGYDDIVNLLLNKKVDPLLKDKNGKTSVFYAAQYGHKNVVELFKKHDIHLEKTVKNYNPPSQLTQVLADREAAVWFLGHSGWAVKTQNHLLIFDYWENEEPPAFAGMVNGHIVPAEMQDQNVVVFVSHGHRDHYFPKILDWRPEVANITYVFGFKPEGVSDYEYVGPREKKIIQDLEITALRSNDTGVGFLVSVDGLVIFHAGDHANRKRDFSGPYTQEIDWIGNQTTQIDIAFFPVAGCGFGDQVAVRKGVYYALDKLKPNVAVPMHAGQWCVTRYQEFADEAKKEGKETPIFATENRGDFFHYENGKIL